MTHCVIILPELLTVPEEAVVDMKLPALENILSRAKSTKVADRCIEQVLMRHFGYNMPPATSLPAAKIRWAADFSEPAPEFCVCADPVHMQADIDHARLMDGASLKLSPGECEQYIRNLNKVFAADGLTFVFGSPDRWYLTGQDASMLETLPTRTLVGRNVANFLPEGDSSAHWRTLTTEVQMLLFSDSMNQTRESQGQLVLNALWLWGGGVYQERVAETAARCYSNDVFCRGLATLNQTPIDDFARINFDDINESEVLLMDGRGMDAIIYGDFGRWQSWIVALEDALFKPLLRAMKSGKVDTVTLSVGNGREYTMQKSKFPAFWRRRKPFQSYVSEKAVELS